MWGTKARIRRRAAKLPAYALDRPLLWLSDHDAWTIRDACEGVQVFGATGSGKTSGSGAAIARAMLSEGFGGLVLTAKPDERDLWQGYARDTGRESHLVAIEPGGRHRFNFLEYELRRPGAGAGQTENIVQLFTTVLETVEQSAGQTPDPYWSRALKQLLRNAVDALVLAGEPISLTAIARVITAAPQHPDELKDADWRERSFCYRCLEAAESHTSTERQRHDLAVTADYWASEFPGLADRTRSSIVSTFTTMADVFLRGELRELFCTGTTLVPELTHEGAVIVLDLPVKEHHQVGQYAQVLFKYLWQRATERRTVDQSTRPVFLWADESQFFANDRDVEFQTTARSAKASTVYLTQNISNYYATLGGGRSQAPTDALLGSLQTKIFHANGDSVTNKWAEELFAKNWAFRASSGATTQQDDSGQDRSQSSSQVSQSLDSEVLARDFTLLARGGPSSGFRVEGILFQAGRSWAASDSNHVHVTFKQVTRQGGSA